VLDGPNASTVSSAGCFISPKNLFGKREYGGSLGGKGLCIAFDECLDGDVTVTGHAADCEQELGIWDFVGLEGCKPKHMALRIEAASLLEEPTY
jgi:hypothetical protein